MRVVNQGAARRLGRACCRAARAPLRPREVHVLDRPHPPFWGCGPFRPGPCAGVAQQKRKIMGENIILGQLLRFP